MSQYYPQQSPVHPPERPPEDDYEYIDEDDYDGSDSSLIQYALAFFAGGCLIFICMSCCFLLAGGLWILDAALVSTPIPGSDLGLWYDEPAYPEDSVVNEQKVRLTVGEVYRNAASTTPMPEGQELIIVTVDLENLNTDEDVNYSEEDFLLLNSPKSGYEPIPGTTINQDSLGRGKLRAETGTQGQLIFQVVAGETGLVLDWESDGGARFILLE